MKDGAKPRDLEDRTFEFAHPVLLRPTGLKLMKR